MYVDFINKQPNVGEGEGEVKLDVTGSIPSQCSYHVHVTTANGTATGESQRWDLVNSVIFKLSVANENALYNFAVATGALILAPKWCVCVWSD